MPFLKKIIGNAIYQSILFGAVLLVVFILIWQTPLKKYNVEIEPYYSESAAQQAFWIAGDFDNDGNSEMIRCSYGEGSSRLDITHYDKDGYLTDQYHIFNSEWNYNLEPAIYDIDGDNRSELLVFTERNDSIFLNAFSLSEFRLTIDHLFFKEIERKRNEYSYKSAFYDFADYNNDGKKELYFWFDAGFGLYPRGIFKIEFPSLEISSTRSEYMALSTKYSSDISGDGIPEIFTRCYAPSNSSQFEKYGDTISYVAIFNSDLEYLFEPIAFPGEYGYVNCIPDLSNDTIFYALFSSRSKNKIPLTVYVLNNKGTILKSKQWPSFNHPESMFFDLFVQNNQAWFFCSGMGYYKLDSELSELPDKITQKLTDIRSPMPGYDLTGDGIDEWISINRKKEAFIYDEKSHETVSFQLPISVYSNIHIFPIYRNNMLIKYLVDTGAGFFYFRYQRNHHYYLLYLIYFTVFLTGSFSVFLILYIQKRTIEKKWSTEKQLSELQFNNVKNQLNPHFLFNALNSVAYMIYEGKNQEAYDFLNVNSRMIQRVMNDANEVKRSLKTELQFTEDYIHIQKHRFKERFDYKIEVHPEVNTDFEVPKMCIHTYVENSIKHGFRFIKKDGLLFIEIAPSFNGITISISDNGVGRKSASQEAESSGNGIRIMKEFYHLFELYYGYKINCRISDLRENSGTLVQLQIQHKTQ